MPFRDQFRRLPVPQRVEQALDLALDKAMDIERPFVLSYLDRVRTRNPYLEPDEVIGILERRYLAAVTGIGGASGAAAALPGAGAVAVFATGAAEVTAFVSASALYVLALAEMYGIPVSNAEFRRTLVLAVLLGEGGEILLEDGERKGSHWAQVLANRAGRNGGRERSGAFDARVRHLLITHFGLRQGALLVGRTLPLGIGAGIGAAGNAALARTAIATARKAFGPPPKRFPPRVIDIDPRW